MDDEDGGLFAIALSDSDADESQKAQDKLAAARRRTEQTEEEYQAVKDSYRTKIENGNVSTISAASYSSFYSFPSACPSPFSFLCSGLLHIRSSSCFIPP